MPKAEAIKVGKRGTIVIPAALRHRLGIEEGTLVLVEEHEAGLLIRPAAAVPVEIYTPERIAEFLLSTAVDEDDYAEAVEEVRQMDIDPSTIQHHRPDNPPTNG